MPSRVWVNGARPQSVASAVEPGRTVSMGIMSSVTSREMPCESRYAPAAFFTHPSAGMVRSNRRMAMLTICLRTSSTAFRISWCVSGSRPWSFSRFMVASRVANVFGSMVADTQSTSPTAAMISKCASFPTIELDGRIHSGSFSRHKAVNGTSPSSGSSAYRMSHVA